MSYSEDEMKNIRDAAQKQMKELFGSEEDASTIENFAVLEDRVARLLKQGTTAYAYGLSRDRLIIAMLLSAANGGETTEESVDRCYQTAGMMVDSIALQADGQANKVLVEMGIIS